MENNIHLIPTDKYSDLVHSTNKYGGYFLSKHYSPMKCMGDSYQNIYITDNSEIREGDAFLHPDNTIERASRDLDGRGLKKIILTTDQVLIKNGVQSINDEFLQWFVKNPSCDRVEVVFNNRGITGTEKILKTFGEYKIILPQEDPDRLAIPLDCTHDIVIKYGVAECQNCGLEESKISKQLTMKFRAFDPKTKTMVYSGTPDLETVSSFFHHWGDYQIMRSTERKDRNGVEIFEGDYLVDRCEDEGEIHEYLYEVVYCPRLMAWAIDISYAQDGSRTESIHEFFRDCLEVKNPLPLTRS